MRHIRTCIVTIIVTIMFLATIWFARTVYAQSDNDTLTILQAVQTVQNTLASLGTSLDSLRNALSLSAQANARFTPPVSAFPTDSVECDVVNVSSLMRVVRLQLINNVGLVIADSNNFPLSAGNTNVLTLTSAGSDEPIYCKFTVVDGSRTDIRGTIEVIQSGVLSARMFISAE